MDDYPKFAVNRMVLVLIYKQPFLDWMTKIDDNPLSLTLDDLRDDNDTFLIPQFDDTDDAVKWVEIRWRFFIEAILFDWIMDESLWPKKRSLKLFREWFDIQIHSMVWDLADEPLLVEEWNIDDEFEDLEEPNSNLH